MQKERMGVMTLEQLKQYRAWRISLQSMRAELKQRHSELLQMENTGVLAQNEQARQRLYALEAQLVQSYLEKEAATREVEQWIAQLPGFKEAIFRLRYLDGLPWEQVAQRTGYSEKQVFWIQRRTMEEDKFLTLGDIFLDDEKHMVYVKDAPCSLTFKEYELLKLLLHNAGIVVTREIILERVWGIDFEGESRTLDMHIRTLRQKLGEAGSMIRTVRNVGYMIE